MVWRRLTRLWAVLLAAGIALCGAALPAAAQADTPPVDSLVVEGNRRVSTEQIIQTSGLVL